MTKRPSTPHNEAPDVATPLTDALIEQMRCDRGVPVCDEWTKLEEHAKEMERMYYAQRAVSAALLK